MAGVGGWGVAVGKEFYHMDCRREERDDGNDKTISSLDASPCGDRTKDKPAR